MALKAKLVGDFFNFFAFSQCLNFIKLTLKDDFEFWPFFGEIKNT